MHLLWAFSSLLGLLLPCLEDQGHSVPVQYLQLFCWYWATLNGALFAFLCLGELSQPRHFTFMFCPDLNLWKENSNIDFLIQNALLTRKADNWSILFCTFFLACLCLCVEWKLCCPCSQSSTKGKEWELVPFTWLSLWWLCSSLLPYQLIY